MQTWFTQPWVTPASRRTKPIRHLLVRGGRRIPSTMLHRRRTTTLFVTILVTILVTTTLVPTATTTPIPRPTRHPIPCQQRHIHFPIGLVQRVHPRIRLVNVQFAFFVRSAGHVLPMRHCTVPSSGIARRTEMRHVKTIFAHCHESNQCLGLGGIVIGPPTVHIKPFVDVLHPARFTRPVDPTQNQILHPVRFVTVHRKPDFLAPTRFRKQVDVQPGLTECPVFAFEGFQLTGLGPPSFDQCRFTVRGIPFALGVVPSGTQ